MPSISTNLQESSFGIVITLFELDTTIYGGGIIRVANTSTPDRQAIVFNGNTYYPFPIEATGFEISSDKAPRPKLSISAIEPIMMASINEYRGLQNCPVLRMRVRREELDDLNPAITTEFINYDVFYINKMTAQNKQYIQFELITKVELASKQPFPRRTMVSYCNHQYRRFDETTTTFIYPDKNACPYTGANYFDEFNQSCAMKDDSCSKTLGGCSARYATDLPFQGFPSFIEG